MNIRVGCKGEPEEREWADDDAVQAFPQVLLGRWTTAELLRLTAVEAVVSAVSAECRRVSTEWRSGENDAEDAPSPDGVAQRADEDAEAERNVGQTDDLRRAA